MDMVWVFAVSICILKTISPLITNVETPLEENDLLVTF
ncbi:hypothetical protein D778_01650 [Xanthomarina gelatinilytica]|uniref:Uncharacterized protein n=1 Tax=Xanthomarina gelatinilytica TaxID=1137281 RepID=M7MLM2_9FLAO|nr:hypothetical protein D778_01650 [Xanthomarina gelatinilytica]